MDFCAVYTPFHTVEAAEILGETPDRLYDAERAGLLKRSCYPADRYSARVAHHSFADIVEYRTLRDCSGICPQSERLGQMVEDGLETICADLDYSEYSEQTLMDHLSMHVLEALSPSCGVRNGACAPDPAPALEICLAAIIVSNRASLYRKALTLLQEDHVAECVSRDNQPAHALPARDVRGSDDPARVETTPGQSPLRSLPLHDGPPRGRSPATAGAGLHGLWRAALL